jgi:hypothetical protein
MRIGQRHRSTSLLCAVGALATAFGCSGADPSSEGTNSAGLACPAFDSTEAALAAQANAHVVLAAIASMSVDGLPGGAGCAALRSDVARLQADAANGSVTMTAGGTGTTCGLPAYYYRLSGVNAEVGAAVAADADACLGPGTSSFVAARSTLDPVYGFTMYLDPSPVTLNAGQTLTTTAGASAAGTDNSGSPATAYEWPTTCRSNTNLQTHTPIFAGGEACSPVPLSAGETATGTITMAQCPPGYAKCILY